MNKLQHNAITAILLLVAIITSFGVESKCIFTKPSATKKVPVKNVADDKKVDVYNGKLQSISFLNNAI